MGVFVSKLLFLKLIMRGISMSKMLDAIIAVKLKEQSFRFNIRDLILTDRSLLMNLRLSYGNLRLNSEPWNTPCDDRVALDEYLATESSDALLNIYTELTSNFIIKKPNYLQNFIGLCTTALRGYLYQIKTIIPKLQAAIETAIKKELEYSKSDEQKFNGFLNYIKIMIGKKQIKEAHKLLQVAEKKLLGGSLTSFGMDSKVEDRVQRNLRLAYSIVYDLPSSIDAIPDLIDQKIKSAASLLKKLITKMTSQKEKIQDPLISKENKQQIFGILQDRQIKLLRFILKTDALAKGKTLHANQSLDLNYMLQQLNKFPSGRDVEKFFCHTTHSDGNTMDMPKSFDRVTKDPFNLKTSFGCLAQQQENAKMERAKYPLNKAIP